MSTEAEAYKALVTSLQARLEKQDKLLATLEASLSSMVGENGALRDMIANISEVMATPKLGLPISKDDTIAICTSVQIHGETYEIRNIVSRISLFQAWSPRDSMKQALYYNVHSILDKVGLPR